MHSTRTSPPAPGVHSPLLTVLAFDEAGASPDAQQAFRMPGAPWHFSIAVSVDPHLPPARTDKSARR